ncbi:Rho guanine nucleotide exchange factor 4 [Cladochytrium tenue]|nr:Rho guanine nucleotide exchange factor 4 [Cladochytrium tenue]
MRGRQPRQLPPRAAAVVAASPLVLTRRRASSAGARCDRPLPPLPLLPQHLSAAAADDAATACTTAAATLITTTALYSFVPQHPGELAVRQGDTVRLPPDPLVRRGWVYAESDAGWGWVPEGFLDLDNVRGVDGGSCAPPPSLSSSPARLRGDAVVGAPGAGSRPVASASLDDIHNTRSARGRDGVRRVPVHASPLQSSRSPSLAAASACSEGSIIGAAIAASDVSATTDQAWRSLRPAGSLPLLPTAQPGAGADDSRQELSVCPAEVTSAPARALSVERCASAASSRGASEVELRRSHRPSPAGGERRRKATGLLSGLRRKRDEPTVAIVGKLADSRPRWVEYAAALSNGKAPDVGERELLRQEVIYEIISTERDYIDDLELILQVGYPFVHFKLRLKPVQRICKYPLFLRELIKYTDVNHPDSENLSKALLKVEAVVTLVNEGARQKQLIDKMVELQAALPRVDIVVASRMLKKFGQVHLILPRGEKKPRELYLFNDLALLVRPGERPKVESYTSYDMILVDASQDAPEDGSFTVELVHVGHSKFRLGFDCQAAKDEWVDALQDLIESWHASKASRGLPSIPIRVIKSESAARLADASDTTLAAPSAVGSMELLDRVSWHDLDSTSSAGGPPSTTSPSRANSFISSSSSVPASLAAGLESGAGAATPRPSDDTAVEPQQRADALGSLGRRSRSSDALARLLSRTAAPLAPSASAAALDTPAANSSIHARAKTTATKPDGARMPATGAALGASAAVATAASVTGAAVPASSKLARLSLFVTRNRASMTRTTAAADTAPLIVAAAAGARAELPVPAAPGCCNSSAEPDVDVVERDNVAAAGGAVARATAAGVDMVASPTAASDDSSATRVGVGGGVCASLDVLLPLAAGTGAGRFASIDTLNSAVTSVDELHAPSKLTAAATVAAAAAISRPVKSVVVDGVVKIGTNGSKPSKDYLYTLRVQYLSAATHTTMLHHALDDFVEFHLQLLAHFPLEAGVAPPPVSATGAGANVTARSGSARSEADVRPPQPLVQRCLPQLAAALHPIASDAALAADRVAVLQAYVDVSDGA